MCLSTAIPISIPTPYSASNSLVRKLERREAGAAPDGGAAERPYAVMTYDFALAPNKKAP